MFPPSYVGVDLTHIPAAILTRFSITFKLELHNRAWLRLLATLCHRQVSAPSLLQCLSLIRLRLVVYRPVPLRRVSLALALF